MKLKKTLLLTSALTLLSACSVTTSIQSKQSGSALSVNQNAPLLLDSKPSAKYSTTSFNQYVFKLENGGLEPMYGIMPLQFNGGYLVADILFFAPAMLFNLREVYRHYEFDAEKGVILYKNKPESKWKTYTPKQAEIERAKQYFLKKESTKTPADDKKSQ